MTNQTETNLELATALEINAAMERVRIAREKAIAANATRISGQNLPKPPKAKQPEATLPYKDDDDDI